MRSVKQILPVKNIKCIILLLVLQYLPVEPSNQTSLGKTRILGGRSCENETYSFIVSIQDKSGNHFCGGTLLNKNWVLTAAHCCLSKLVKVVLGRDTPEETVRWIAKVYPHPSFKFLLDDIGLLRLHKSVQESDYITFVNIPKGGILNEIKDICSTALVMGWGKLTASSKKPSSSLQCVDLPILYEEECRVYYRPVQWVFVSAMCTLSEEHKDTCQGDSGGPALCKENNLQLGIVSFGKECGDPTSPAVYTRVDGYISFISDTMSDNNEYTVIVQYLFHRLVICMLFLNILK